MLAEESDENGRGGFASHYDLYRRAMKNFAADTSTIDKFVDRLQRRGACRHLLGRFTVSRRQSKDSSAIRSR